MGQFGLLAQTLNMIPYVEYQIMSSSPFTPDACMTDGHERKCSRDYRIAILLGLDYAAL